MKIAKSLILSTLALGMTVGAYATFAAPEQESKTFVVSSANGSLEAASTSTWTSNDAAPRLIVNFPGFMMTPTNDMWNVAYCKGKTVTFTTDEGWYVSEIAMNIYGDTSGQVEIGETSCTPTTGSDVVRIQFAQDQTPAIHIVTTGSGLYFRNFNVTVSKMQEVTEPVDPVVTVPAAGKYYRLLTRFNGDQSQARYGSCIELLRDDAGKGNNAQADRLWSNAPAEEGADNYDYQWFTFEADPAGSGYYALVSKAKPEGSVNSTPSVANNSNTARWDYDNTTKHYGFYLVESVNSKPTQGTDEAGFYSALTSKEAADGWYMNTSAGGQGFSVHLFSDPTDQNAGIYTFEPMPEVEEPIVPEPAVAVELDRTLWTADASSQTEDGAVESYGPQVAFDDNTATYWGNSWLSAPGFDDRFQVFHVDLGATEYIDSLSYVNRQSGAWDVLHDYEIYVTDQAVARVKQTGLPYYLYDFTGLTPVASGSLEIRSGQHAIEFDEQATGRHIYIKALSAYGSETQTSYVFTVAELKAYKHTEETPEQVEPDMVTWSVEEPSAVFNSEGKWSISGFCCEEPSGEGAGQGVINNLIDDNVSTYYHSNWSSNEYKGHHGFVLDLGESTETLGLSWVPRQNAGSNNGRWLDYSVWFFDSADDLPTFTNDHTAVESYLSDNTPDAKGTLTAVAGDGPEVSMFDAPVTTRYMLVIPTGNLNWSCAAEVGIVKNVSKELSATRADFLHSYLSDLTAYGKLLPGADELAESIKEALESQPSEMLIEAAPEAVEGMKQGLAMLLEALVTDENGNFVTITNVRRGEYLALKAVEATETIEAYTSANTLTTTAPDAVWTLTRNDENAAEGTFQIRNANVKGSVAGFIANTDMENADLILADYDAETTCVFEAQFTTSGIAFVLAGTDKALNINSYGGNLTTYAAGDAGSMWTIGEPAVSDAVSDEGYFAAVEWDGVTDGYTDGNALTAFHFTLPLDAEATNIGLGFIYDESNSEFIHIFYPTDLTYDEETKVWSYTLPEAITTDAYYSLNFVNNAFCFTEEDGSLAYSKYITSSPVLVHYVPDVEVALQVSPAAGEVTELTEVKMWLADDNSFDVNYTTEEAITLSKGTSVIASVLPVELEAPESYEYFYWTLPEACTEPGTYTLSVPARSLSGETGYNAATTVTWTIKDIQSGITDVTVNGEASKAYDLQGRRVVRPVRGSLNIVDGKKVIVRK